MRLVLLFLGKTRQGYLAEGIADFAKRLRRFTSVTIKVLKEQKPGQRGPAEQIRCREARQLLEQVGGGMLVALDCRGTQLSSEELAARIGRWQDQGVRDVTFVLGGPLGLDREVLDRADLILSLSRLTFTHEMARLLLLEQLYRAWAIRANTGYHK